MYIINQRVFFELKPPTVSINLPGVFITVAKKTEALEKYRSNESEIET